MHNGPLTVTENKNFLNGTKILAVCLTLDDSIYSTPDSDAKAALVNDRPVMMIELRMHG